MSKDRVQDLSNRLCSGEQSSLNFDSIAPQLERGSLPPLNTVLPNLITVPLQNPLIPSSFMIVATASMVVVALAD